jgi:hypothetical protein
MLTVRADIAISGRLPNSRKLRERSKAAIRTPIRAETATDQTRSFRSATMSGSF